MKLKIIKMDPKVKTPVYATKGSACFDIFSNRVYVSDAGSRTECHGTGLQFEIPEGKALLIYSRSGHGFNKDIRLANCVGIIDSDYRGELKIKLTCDNDKMNYVGVRVGERIAQGMLIDVGQVEFEEMDELSETERGEGGFGSTDGEQA